MAVEWVQINVTGTLVPYVGSPPPDTGYLYKDGATIFDPQDPGFPFPFGPTTPFDQWSPQTGHYSSIGVEAGSIGTVYTDAQFSALLASNTIVGGHYANTGYQSFYQIQLNDLGPGPWPYNYYLGDPVSIPVPNPYAGGNTFTYYSHMWAEIPVPSTLFTTGAETVNFNNLDATQQAAVAGGADLYNALGGGDTITLPNANFSVTSVALAGTNKTFDLTHVFNLADKAGDTTSITGGNGSYNIALGAGSDTVTINGAGTTKITAGTGVDTLSISGGGKLVVDGNLTGGSSTIGANSTFELNGTDSGTITFDPLLGSNETLRIDGTTMPTGIITGFVSGDTIDLKGVTFDAKSATVLQTSNNSVVLNNVLHVFENGKDYQLDLNPNEAFVGSFALAPDGLGGTDVTFSQSAPAVGLPGTLNNPGYSTSIYPYAAIVNIKDSGGGGTGFIIGPNTILTAAHVVESPGGLYDGLTISGSNGSSLAVQSVYVDPDWAKTMQTIPGGGPAAATPFDWAVITISTDLTSFGKFQILPDYSGGTVNVTGYPQILQNNELTKVSQTMASGGTGLVLQETPGISQSGESGGPTWFYDGSTAWAVGINSNTSQSVLITSDDWKQIQNVMSGNIVSGKVINHYISGATVFADTNGTGQLAANDASTTTDSTGSFSLTGGSGPLIAFGGTDTSTGLPFKGQLSAPAGSTDITPLTTLLTNLSSDPSAEQKVLSNLGLSSKLELTTFDPIAAAQGGSADGAATEIAGEKVYDTVEMIASALAGAGATFTPSLQAAFSSLASALDGTGINLGDKTALSGLITQVTQTENVTLGQGVADAVASVIAAGNAALDHVLQTDQPGSQLLSDAANIELVEQGVASTALTNAAGNLTQLQVVANTFTGAPLSGLLSEGFAVTPASISGVEGAEISTTVATVTDSNPNAAATDFSATISWGDGSVTPGTVVVQTGGGFAVQGGHTYTEEGSYQVSASINDVGGSTATATGTATISDAPLAATAASLSGTEGTAITATVASFTDANPNAAASDFTATINWGDGTTTPGTVVAKSGGGFAVAGAHSYAEEGSYQVSASINDVGGSTATATGTGTISDAPLTPTAASLSGIEGTAITATVARFIDANPNAAASDFAAMINWGDGSTTVGTVVAQNGGGFAVAGAHTYAEEGSYQVSASINDVGGSATTATTSATVADALHLINPSSNGVARGQTLSVSAAKGVLANDSDPDDLGVEAVNGRTKAVGHAIEGKYGSLTLNADGSYTYKASHEDDDWGDHEGGIAQDVFKYTVSDGHGGLSTSTLSIVVFDRGTTYLAGANTTLTAGNGPYVLDGSAGGDTLRAGRGDAVLIGGNGDTLISGRGEDNFLFRPDFGANTITNFNVHRDTLQFDDATFHSVRDILAHTTDSAIGAVISDGHGDTVTLLGVTASQLHHHQNEFHLV